METHKIIILLSLSMLFLTCEKMTSSTNNIELKNDRATYIFSKEGIGLVEVNFDEAGNLFSVVTDQGENSQALFFYEESGVLKSKTILRPDGGVTEREYFFFEETGILKSFYEYRDTFPYQGGQYYDTTGTEKAFLFFDEYGELDEKIEISRDGETIVSYGKDSIRHSIERVN